MGTLRYAILGLLNRKSMTGYDLKKEFETTLFEFWSAKHSQIYPELKELVNEGLISYEIAITGSVLEKKVYTITKEGATQLHNWLIVKDNKYVIAKDEFKLRLFFSDLLNGEERLEMLNLQYQIHFQQLTHFKEQLKKFSSIPPKETSQLTDYLVLLGGIKREEMLCGWLEECIKLFAKN